ncbi:MULTISPECIES: formyltransferase family protein [unclassified Halomonas]|uniref:formyltransferase family protein n=1 Tax=unclassified Halomonas TaxID=2609666 RepID=UPI0009908752|nr:MULTISPECIES: formyltransferase family protein [unclassified Halomonas]AQU84855.1 hypothetical protein B2G49_21040 [Halomonas sp. 'Soap Lake \
MKIAALVSTNGSVLRACLEKTSEEIDFIIVDRECGAEKIANDFNIPLKRLEAKGQKEFSEEVFNFLKSNNINYLVLFFSRILTGELINYYDKKIINFHPSILPSHPGVRGFEDSLSSGSLFIGSTVHFVDSGIDSGFQIAQCKSHSFGQDETELRHTIFAQQVASLFQVIRSIRKGEFMPEERKIFPELDYLDANSFSCPIFEEDVNRLYFDILRG